MQSRFDTIRHAERRQRPAALHPSVPAGIAASCRRRDGRAGVTLIELLVVILVIGILIGLLMPALGPLRHRGRVALADSGRSVLRDAIRQYHFEYGVWPIPYPPEITEFRDNNHLVLERLDVRHPDNRKEIRFLQTEDYHFDGDGNILDPWGRPYTIAFNLTRNRVAISYDTPPRN